VTPDPTIADSMGSTDRTGHPRTRPIASAIVLLPEPARPDMTINTGSVCSILKGPETWP